MRNEPQLITYVDRLGGDLAGLRELLDGPLSGAFGGVHLLPFFHPIDGADAGFDPIDHTVVDSRLGTWDDVAALGADRPLMADMIVNHMSSRSPQFQDWQAKGPRSDYDGMFLTYDAVFTEGATERDLLTIYRPRPGLCFTTLGVGGVSRLVWTTFTANQIDLDVGHPATVRYYRSILDRFEASGVTMVRLDAVGYAVKRPGTSSFMIPETFAFIDDLAQDCRSRGMEVLVEIHSNYRTQMEVASRVDWVYDFALPPLMLDALGRGTVEALRHWLEIRPTNAVTVLDTHDGIGVIDVGRDQTDRTRLGILSQDQISKLVETIHEASNGQSRQATGAAADNLDLYQINCTYYDAVGRDDDKYLLSRLIQMLVPGIPQVYYVGALAGVNDMQLLAETRVGRDINRHYYTPDEIEAALERPVVRRLLSLLRWRRSRSELFDGTFTLEPAVADPAAPSNDTELVLSWVADDGRNSMTAHLDVVAATFRLELMEGGVARTVTDLAEL